MRQSFSELRDRANECVLADTKVGCHAQQVSRFQRRYRQAARASDVKGNGLKIRIQGGRDEIVGGRESQPVASVEHGEVFEVRIRVADQKAGQYPAQETVRFYGDACRRSKDELPHVFVSPLVLVIARVFTEELVELLNVDTLAVACSVKAWDYQGVFLDRRQVNDVHVDDVFSWQEGAHGFGGQVFELEQVRQVARGKFRDMGAEFVRSDRAVATAVLHHEQLSLDAGKGGLPQRRGDRRFIRMIELLVLGGFRILDGNGAREVTAETKKEGEAAGRIDPKSAGLRVAKPAPLYKV